MRRREFPAKVKLQAWERANGCCEQCTAKLFPGNIIYDHINPDALGGEPILSNCKCVCRTCSDRKTFEQDIPAIAKSRRIHHKNIGIRNRTTFRGWRRFNGRIVHADDRR